MVSFVLYPFGGILTFQLLSSVVCLLVWEPKGWHSIDAMAPLVVHYLLSLFRKVLAHWLLLSTRVGYTNGHWLRILC
ncbi:unnamed protein product [Cuscuta campestris]|uniref:Uncharacterized protein n=1 Tax=Cuscuta campestris TaxID=132261 RepID=A0A484MJ21_9ASTE|nr:unnamed protein product [Cuscuta campestris]